MDVPRLHDPNCFYFKVHSELCKQTYTQFLATASSNLHVPVVKGCPVEVGGGGVELPENICLFSNPCNTLTSNVPRLVSTEYGRESAAIKPMTSSDFGAGV